MVTRRPVPPPPPFAQLDLPARLRALWHVPFDDQTDPALDLARVQPVCPPLSAARDDHRDEKLTHPGLGRVQRPEPNALLQSWPARHRDAGAPNRQHHKVEPVLALLPFHLLPSHRRHAPIHPDGAAAAGEGISVKPLRAYRTNGFVRRSSPIVVAGP